MPADNIELILRCAHCGDVFMVDASNAVAKAGGERYAHWLTHEITRASAHECRDEGLRVGLAGTAPDPLSLIAAFVESAGDTIGEAEALEAIRGILRRYTVRPAPLGVSLIVPPSD
jgi:hypothetical protein